MLVLAEDTFHKYFISIQSFYTSSFSFSNGTWGEWFQFHVVSKEVIITTLCIWDAGISVSLYTIYTNFYLITCYLTHVTLVPNHSIIMD